MAVASLANRIQVNTNCANNDALYGPYNSIAEAISSIPSALLNGEGAVGRTIGITENGLVIEYWWQLIKAGDTPSQNQYGFTKKGLSLEDIPEFPDVDGKIEEAINNIEFPDYTKTFKELSEASKNNADNLNLLKDNIFNPDGSVNNNFISTMMLRVGADSMNYHMLKTKTIFNSDGTKELTNGTLTNYSFSVLEEDTLAHFIYTDGNLNGEWKISGGYITSLNPGETYFICLKCNRNNEVGVWECSTTQHKVDEDENYWYFNWGILVYDKDGNYNLIETRGNAYMYGDNLMCGKISTMTGNSYFDLTHGNFVLGDGTGPALEYINGVLTIRGSKGDAEETLAKLGIIEKGISQAQSTADAANTAITAEQATRQAAIAELQKQVAAEEEARTEAIAGLKSVQSSLQAQIDGEVTSWFLEGTPANNYYPASEWTDNTLKERHLGDTYTNMLPSVVNFNDVDADGNPLWIEEGFLSMGSTYHGYLFEEQRYIANGRCRTKSIMELPDVATTFTYPDNVQAIVALYDADKKYVANYNWDLDSPATIPAKSTSYKYFSIGFANDNYSAGLTRADLKGISCDKTFICPEAGLSWRWCNFDDMDDSTWHWHKIADSDAVKALQEAGKAQATADGKSTIFSLTGSNKPTNYQKGDMWILQSDTIHTAGKKGDILNANADSATYVASHWTKEVKYTDDTAVLNLEIGGRNLASLSIAQKAGYSYEKYTHNGDADYWKFDISTLYSQTNSFNNDMFGLTYKENTQYAISVRGRWLTEVTEGDTSYGVRMYVDYTDGTREYGLFFVYGSDGSWTCITNASKSVKKIGLIYNRHGYYAMKIKIEQGNKVTAWTPAPEDVEAEILAAEQKADKAQQGADKANNQLDAIDNDNVIARSEKATIETQLEQVQAEYSDIVADAGKYSISTSTFESAYNKAVAALHYHCGKTYKNVKPTTNEENGSIPIVTDTTKDYCYSNISAYYSARQTILVAITEAAKAYAEDVAIQQAQQALDGLEIGGRNLLTNSELKHNITGYATNRGTLTLVDGEYTRFTTNSENNYHILYLTNLVTTTVTRITECDNLIFSFMMRCSNTTDTMYIQFAFKDANGTVKYLTTSYFKAKDSEWNKVEISPNGNMREWIKNNNLIPSTVSLYFVSNAKNATIELYNLKLEQGNKATAWSPAPEDVDSKADAIKAIADGAAASAKQSNDQLANMSNDSILTPQEKGSVANEWACIQKEYTQNTTNATSMGMLSDAAYTTYKGKYDALSTYVSGLALSTKSNTTIVQSTFQTRFSEYYAANVAFLNALADKVAKLEVDNLEVGGRNLLRYTDQNVYFNKFTGYSCSVSLVDGWVKATQNSGSSTSGVVTDKTSDISLLEKGKSYVLSFDAYLDGSASVDTLNLSYHYVMSDGGNFALQKSVLISKTKARYNVAFTYNGTTTQSFGAMVGAATTNCPIFYVKNIKLEKGNKATDWTPAPEDVDAAIENAEGNGINLISYQTDKWRRTTCSESSSVGTSYDNVIKGHSTTRVSLVSPIEVSGNIYVKVHNSANEVFITEFDANKLYVGKYHGWISDQVVKLSQNTKYIGVTIRNSSNTTIVLSDIKGAKVKIEKGVNQTPWSSSPEDSELEMQAATSKAEALDYLKAALTDGSTEITGGLTMTNVLMLKNLAGSVTAGLSGLTKHNNLEDKVLLWGGGTYEEAYAAANNNTYNTGSGTITTLIKKDGTGKIGIFKISDTQAIVDVPNQGQVVIDASSGNGGVFVKNTSGDIKAAVINGSISSHIPVDKQVTTITSKTFNINNTTSIQGSSGTCTTSTSGILWDNIVTTKYESGKTTKVILEFKDFQFKQQCYKLISGGKVTIQVRIVPSNGNVGYMKEFTLSNITYTSSSFSSSNNGIAELTMQNFSLNTSVNGNFKVEVAVSGNSGVCLGKFYAGGTITCKTEVTTSYTPKTIIGTDGVIAAQGAETYFMVQNTSKGQKICARGLSATKGTAGSGELYISNSSNAGLVKTLKESFETLKTFFNTIKYDGSDKTAREAASSAIDSITSALDGISIVANS